MIPKFKDIIVMKISSRTCFVMNVLPILLHRLVMHLVDLGKRYLAVQHHALRCEALKVLAHISPKQTGMNTRKSDSSTN